MSDNADERSLRIVTSRHCRALIGAPHKTSRRRSWTRPFVLRRGVKSKHDRSLWGAFN
jgi:hypothetical protein